MGKTYEEEQYERGVHDGQKEGYFNDMWNPLRFYEPKEYIKGYEYGKEHRYNENGERYHNYSGTGINDKKEDKESSSDSNSSGSSCYLTTACINARGLADNCLELKTLRNFRDKILMKDYAGRKAIREYYKIAPLIVDAVNKREDSQSIWDNLYKEIRKAVSFVRSRDFNGAFEHYREMTSNLKERYLE